MNKVSIYEGHIDASYSQFNTEESYVGEAQYAVVKKYHLKAPFNIESVLMNKEEGLIYVETRQRIYLFSYDHVGDII